MFHPRQGAPGVNHQNVQHHGLHHQWYQAYHHQGGFAPTEENGWHHHHLSPHIYPPSPDINDFLQGNLVHGVNFQQGYPMVQPPAQQHHRVPYSVDMHTHVSGSEVPQMPSPISGSDMSSPGLNPGEMSPQAHSSHPVNRPPPVRSPYEWIKKNSYQNQPNPGKTRTKDKYRVVYTDHQRVELEKEFYFSRYITIRKKSELAVTLGLSERQVKIWFQNRRAKERKQSKKRQEMAMTKDPLEITLDEQQHQQQQQTSTILNHAVSPNQGISLM